MREGTSVHGTPFGLNFAIPAKIADSGNFQRMVQYYFSDKRAWVIITYDKDKIIVEVVATIKPEKKISVDIKQNYIAIGGGASDQKELKASMVAGKFWNPNLPIMVCVEFDPPETNRETGIMRLKKKEK